MTMSLSPPSAMVIGSADGISMTSKWPGMLPPSCLEERHYRAAFEKTK
jgi:hypothetical protein